MVSRDKASTTNFLILAVCISILALNQAMACPAYLSASSIPNLIGRSKRNLLLVRYSARNNQLVSVPLQFEKKSILGRHIFEFEKSFSDLILTRDKFVIDSVYGGNKLLDRNKLKKYCEIRNLYQLSFEGTKRKNYLIECNQISSADIYEPTVKIDKMKRSIRSFHYDYIYDSSNHMLFDRIDIKGEADSIATESRLVIGADVKNFINLVFDSNDWISQLEFTEERPVGLAARVTFYLKILFFKIQMDLRTDLSFYSNSAHIPMVATTPVNAFDYVNPGSGIIYLWKSNFKVKKVNMPSFSKSKDTREVLNQYCNHSTCSFGVHYQGTSGREFSLNFKISSALAQKEFYPRWVSKDNQLNDLDWVKSIKKTIGEQGVYFETSKLPKGSHRWNFWLNIGTSKSKTCPDQLKVTPLSLN